MERLTNPLCGGYELPMIPMEIKTQDDLQKFHEVRKFYESCAIRCGQYEDTGLEPEEIKELCTDDVAEVAKMFRKMIESGEINHLQDLLQAEQDGRLVVLPCKVGDKVLVDARTLPYNYLHPADGCGSFAKCEIVAIVTTKKETYLKLRALYPSRAGRRDYLKYGVTAIGKTVFLTREEAEAALAQKGDSEQ